MNADLAVLALAASLALPFSAYADVPGRFRCTDPAPASEQAWESTAAPKRVRRARVIGGRDADPSVYPWQVAVRALGDLCGGSLIGRKFVLTAAHCVDRIQHNGGVVATHEPLLVNRAEPSGGSRGESRRASHLYVHPDWRGRREPGMPGDVALIVLDSGFDIDPDQLAVLASERTDPLFAPAQACAVVTGWGATGEDGRVAERLQFAEVPLTTTQACRDAYPDEAISEHHLCAGFTQGGVDSCQGDSGGPLVVRGGPRGWLQVGVVSWGYGCAERGHYGVYARVASYRPWLERTIATHMAREDQP